MAYCIPFLEFRGPRRGGDMRSLNVAFPHTESGRLIETSCYAFLDCVLGLRFFDFEDCLGPSPFLIVGEQ
jgi:hypothetical protein